MDTAANLLMRGVALNMKAVNFPIEERSPTLLSDLPVSAVALVNDRVC